MESNEKEQSGNHLPSPTRPHLYSFEAEGSNHCLDTSETEQQDHEPDVRSPGNQADPVLAGKDWTGDDDPDNPINWARWKRIYHTMIPSIQAFTM